jgi:hypothetical protein
LHVEGQFDPNNPLTPRERALMLMVVPLFLASIWNLVELLRFKRRARPVYAGLIAYCALITPLAGPYVEPGLAVATYYIASVLSGIAFAAMWWAPTILTRFDERGAQRVRASIG